MTGKDIRLIRSQLLLLQEELAKELKVSICTIRLWEQGKMGMSLRRQKEVFSYCKAKGLMDFCRENDIKVELV